MRPHSRLAFTAAIALAWCAMLTVAHADNCGSPEDCKTAPENINAGTAAAAAAAAAAAEAARRRRAAEKLPDEDYGSDFGGALSPPLPVEVDLPGNEPEPPSSKTIFDLDAITEEAPPSVTPDAPSDAVAPSDGSAPLDRPPTESGTDASRPSDAAGQDSPRGPSRGGVPDGAIGDLSDLRPDAPDKPGTPPRKPGS
jgi:hypothetical protein